MSKLGDRIALLSSANFFQAIKQTFSQIKEKQTTTYKNNTSTATIPIVFIGDQSNQSPKKIAHHVIDILKRLNFIPLYIDPWLHKSHQADGYLQLAIYNQAKKSKIHRKSLFTHTFFRFIVDKGSKLTLLLAAIIFSIVIWHIDQVDHSELLAFFSKSAISMLVITLLIRFIASPISKMLNNILFKNHDHSYAISRGEMDKLITNSYRHNAPYVILIEHLSWCDPTFIINLLDRAMILARRGTLVIVSGNQFLLNSAIRKGNAMIEDLNKSSAEEFFKERYAFNFYFGFQIYNSHILQNKLQTSNQSPVQEEIKPFLQHNTIDKANNIISSAISAYDITHDQLTGLYTSIDFYQQFLDFSTDEDLELVAAFLIAYRYDRYYLKNLLSNLQKRRNNEPIDEQKKDNQAMTRHHLLTKFDRIFSNNSDSTLALTQLTADLLFSEQTETTS